VPINPSTQSVIGSLMASGRVRRAYLGIAGGPRPLPPHARGLSDRDTCVEVVEVVAASPADRAGLRPEDLILEVNGATVARVEDLQQLMVAELIGRKVPVRLLRQGRELEVDLVPDELR
jgi:S1-C subfamily serine protease